MDIAFRFKETATAAEKQEALTRLRGAFKCASLREPSGDKEGYVSYLDGSVREPWWPYTLFRSLTAVEPGSVENLAERYAQPKWPAGPVRNRQYL